MSTLPTRERGSSSQSSSCFGAFTDPKQLELWEELPRSRVGKVLKADVRRQLLQDQGPREP